LPFDAILIKGERKKERERGEKAVEKKNERLQGTTSGSSNLKVGYE
jgi:hypothetical protein